MAAHVIDFFAGWEKYNELLVGALSPLDEEQLSWSPGAELWSVRRLANHIVAARAWWFGGWMGIAPDSLKPLINYDDDADADNRDARTICHALDTTWRSLQAPLQTWTERDLDQRFQRPIPNEEGQRPWRTRAYIVWHVAEHDVHHGGEISIILGMHGGRGLDL